MHITQFAQSEFAVCSSEIPMGISVEVVQKSTEAAALRFKILKHNNLFRSRHHLVTYTILYLEM